MGKGPYHRIQSEKKKTISCSLFENFNRKGERFITCSPTAAYYNRKTDRYEQKRSLYLSEVTELIKVLQEAEVIMRNEEHGDQLEGRKEDKRGEVFEIDDDFGDPLL